MFKKKTLADQIEYDLQQLEKDIHAAELAVLQNTATLAWHKQKQAFLLKVKQDRAQKPVVA